jgi:hypothetical protein
MMKMYKKMDGDKKPKAAAKPTVKAKVVVKVKPATAPSPKKAYTPTPAQKKKSAEAGRAAAEKSRAEGKKMGAFNKFIERERQSLDNDAMSMPYTKGANITKDNRYRGLSDKQLGKSRYGQF